MQSPPARFHPLHLRVRKKKKLVKNLQLALLGWLSALHIFVAMRTHFPHVIADLSKDL
jgi:hypothetical protein